MKENEINIDSLVRHLSRHYKSLDEESIRQKIEGYIEENPTATKQQVFTDLSEGKGVERIHLNQYEEGEVTKKDQTRKRGRTRVRGYFPSGR